jgi:hypothetical protein
MGVPPKYRKNKCLASIVGVIEVVGECRGSKALRD